MKVVILAGGRGTRLVEETDVRPKPMVEIGDRPILWHIMKMYASHGLTDFIVCCGYKGYVMKEYFANYFLHQSDITVDMKTGDITAHRCNAEPWTVTLVDTGLDSNTGGRIKRVRNYLDEDEPFCLTYGDAVSDVDIRGLIAFHLAQQALATVTAVRPPARFGALLLDGPRVEEFREKPEDGGGWVNGGFFVCHPDVTDEIGGDATIWEREPLEDITARGQLASYRHEGFWQPMDTMRDKLRLQDLWDGGDPPWRVW
ncbi:MAG TPA: glucose-1-phosphate cytidylyltransferase [Acidimicrobiales bacterium]|nr:glucose-1-phosphate cytidylyltransferase [Acidimicrobiales bacterium]